MPINAIQTTSPQFQQPKQKTTTEKIKNTIDINKDGDVKLEGSLLALGLTAMAGIALAMKGKKAKIPQVSNSISEISNSASSATIKTGAPKTVPYTPKTVQELEQQAQQQGQQAVEAFKQGLPYNKAKKVATRNLPHQNKITAKQKLKEAKLEQLRIHNENVQASHNIQQAIDTASINQNIASANISSKTSSGIEQQMAIYKNAARDAQEANQAAQELAKLEPTRKNIQRASHARQQSETIQAQSQKKMQRLQEKKEKLIQKEEQSYQNALEQMEKSTFEARQEGQIKMLSNENKTQINSIKREEKKLIQQPRTQREMQKMRYWTPEKLQTALQSPDKNVRCAAQQLLAQIH